MTSVKCIFCGNAPILPHANFGLFNVAVNDEFIQVCGYCVSEFVLRAWRERKLETERKLKPAPRAITGAEE